MSRDADVQSRLFHLATRTSRYHGEDPRIVYPEEVAPIPTEKLFFDGGRRVLELGSGWGEFATAWLRQNPTDCYVAFEIKWERIKRTLRRLEALDRERPGMRNRLRVVPVNFQWFLNEILPDHAFDWIVINFPDPWPKRRHWKHRLIQPGTAERLAALLRPGGIIHLATDYGPYARKILARFRRTPGLRPCFSQPDFRRERPPDWPATRFETIHLNEGLRPYYQQWQRSE